MFGFDGAATLRSSKSDRGSSEDAKVVMTLKFEGSGLKADAAARVLGADNGAALLQALFRERSRDPDENSRFTGIAWIESIAKIDEKHSLQIEDLPKVRVSRLYGIRVKPRAAGMCDLRFTATVHEPPDAFIDGVTKLIKREVDIDLTPDEELPLDKAA